MSELKYERLGDAFNDYPDSTLVIRKQFVDSAIAELKEEIAEFKEAQRWRKFPDEKPEKGQKVLFRAKYKTDNIRTWIGEFRNVDFEVLYASAPGWGCEFLPNEIFGWMPLPAEPKEEK